MPLSLASMTLSYPYGTAHTVSEPPAALYFAPTATSLTVTLSSGLLFAAEPLNWVAVQDSKFKQIKDLTRADRVLTLMPSTSYPYQTFSATTSTPLTVQQRQNYLQITSVVLSSSTSGLPVNTLVPIQTVTPTNRCFCLISDKDCTEGGNLIPTPVVSLV